MRTTAKSAAIILTAAAALVACANEQPTRTLTGTSWQLVSIQSMADQQPTSVPDPSKFTVAFGADGRASFQLDCNRGTSPYTAEPSADGTSGSLTFGPIAVTEMFCAQPSMDEQVTTSLQFVRTYLVTDDELHLSKLADGGILTWRPA
ncbi:META domain-containing protein [[Mycobacterium] burgundiense]|uniref:META domain-containing protein n=1 Tax=[Mycobacterium] burgundiense TaxID=3064286 RepID=A0ABM9LNT2_9MYCO|nr:META domain-containing protein [Mycolicibacterium sp. MU0053]CAJ1502211.1 META domain-containing protein [Mycolicibacterium sp. MU0053]